MPIQPGVAARSDLGVSASAAHAVVAEATSGLALSGSAVHATGANPRHQRGTVVTLGISPGKADRLPVASVVGPGSVPLGTYPMPMLSGTSAPSYQLSLRLPGGIALGTYQVTFSYSVGGVSGSASEQFDVIPGGDSGGEVISLYSHDRPEARYVLAQIGAGKLVQGRNPHL
jgi:hypothetical protein